MTGTESHVHVEHLDIDCTRRGEPGNSRPGTKRLARTTSERLTGAARGGEGRGRYFSYRRWRCGLLSRGIVRV
jgi:hypothetical protein